MTGAGRNVPTLLLSPPGLRLVAPVDWTAEWDEDARPVPQVSTYSLMTNEHGHFARSAVDGAWRYEFRR
ncbi:hypothetical protein ACGFZU_35275 [Streptomyces tendae]|uniref:hypothetical protein n=1 Tax=Streptomyces tendae TaxID=1932 RepID=UPI00371EDB51